VEVEIVYANLDYNLLLGRNWVYAMVSIVSYLFHIICIPHEWIIFMIDHFSYSPNDPNVCVNSIVPLVKNTK